jgi:hypothetical protein
MLQLFVSRKFRPTNAPAGETQARMGGHFPYPNWREEAGGVESRSNAKVRLVAMANPSTRYAGSGPGQ